MNALNIVVLAKYVPDATADRSFGSDNTVDRAGVDGILSELDENPIEEALTLAEATDGQVTVLSVGPDQAKDAVKKALQMGAHAGVHVNDEAIHGSDVFATSLVLAKALEKIGSYDLVLTGMASTDGGTSVVPALLAERLGLPQLTFASSLAIADGQARIERDTESASETVEASLPAVVSVTDHINEPRYPSFKQIMAAKKKTIDEWTLADLGLSGDEVGAGASRTKVRSIEKRPPRERGEVVTDEGDGGAKLVEYLATQKFV